MEYLQLYAEDEGNMEMDETIDEKTLKIEILLMTMYPFHLILPFVELLITA